MDKAAITGASGYVGSALAENLRAAGWAVAPWGRSAGAEGRRFRLGETPPDAAFAGISLLVHAAYDFQAHGWDEIARVNIEGTRRLFDAAAGAGVRHFILVSSLSAFPGCRSLYGRAKLEIEEIARVRGAEIVRPGLVFGPRPAGMLGALDGMARLPGIVPLVGDGRYLQYLAHQDDLGALVSALAARPGAGGGRPIVAANRRPYSLREIMLALAAAGNRTPRFLSIPPGLIDAGLKVLEGAGLRPRMRRDSLLSLLHPDPSPDFAPLERLGIEFRPFLPADRA